MSISLLQVAWLGGLLEGEGSFGFYKPKRDMLGKGLCKECYMREWRKKTGRNGTYYRNRAKEATA